jgi:hypothetical protein
MKTDDTARTPSCKTPSMSTIAATDLESFNHLNKAHNLEYVYTWFKDNRDKFRPALDVLSKSFLDKHGIDNAMEVMIMDARDPDFDSQILYT